jgi:hypothetical protein
MTTQSIYIQSGKRVINVTADTVASLKIERIVGDWSLILVVDEQEFTMFKIMDEVVTGVKMTMALSDLETIRVAADFCIEAERYGTE